MKGCNKKIPPYQIKISKKLQGSLGQDEEKVRHFHGIYCRLKICTWLDSSTCYLQFYNCVVYRECKTPYYRVAPTKMSKLKIMQWSNKKWKDHPVSTKAAELKTKRGSHRWLFFRQHITRWCAIVPWNVEVKSRCSMFVILYWWCSQGLQIIIQLHIIMWYATKLRRISSFHWFICVFFILIGQVSSSICICICIGALSLVLISW